jgi:hypothetical protein
MSGNYTKDTQMKRLAILTAIAITGMAAAANAETPVDLAHQHLDAIAAGDVAKITSQYSAGSWLSWVGGQLDGTYVGPQQIGGVWTRFAKAMTPLKLTVGEMREGGNPAGSTVTADVTFTGKNVVKVRYVMLYRGGQLVDEIWQIDPKAPG